MKQVSSKYLLIILVTLFVFVSFLFFMNRKSDSSNKGDIPVTQVERNTEAISQNDKKEDTNKSEESNNKNDKVKEIEGITYEDITTDPYEQFKKEYAEMAMDVAVLFAKKLTEFNGDNPNENMENALPHATPALRGFLQSEGQMVRPTVEFYKRKVTKITAAYKDNFDDIVIVISCYGDFYNDEGKKSESTLTEYLMMLKLDSNDKFFVADYSILSDGEYE